MASNRSFAAGRFALGVGGEFAGFVRKVSGGVIKSDVVTHDLGTTYYQRKNLGLVEYEPLTFEIAMGMGKPIWDWILASWEQGFVQKNCELQLCNFNHEVQVTRLFQDAYIKKVTVPALDAGSKEGAYFTVEIEPVSITYERGDGRKIQGEENTNVKRWLCSNFRFELGDLPCKRVAKVDSFSWEQKQAVGRAGNSRVASKEPATLSIPNLKVSISSADMQPWAEWHRSFVIEGHCTDADELNGSLTFLSPNLRDELGIISFKHVGIVSMEQQAMEANTEQLARFDVELYVEEMFFELYNM